MPDTTNYPSKMSNDELLPPIIQISLLIATMFFCFFLGQGVTYLFANASGVELQEALSKIKTGEETINRNLFRTIALFSNAFTFIIPALIFSIFMYRREWLKKLSLDKTPYTQWIVMATTFMMAGFLFSQFTFWLNKQIPLPSWANEMEAETSNFIKSFLVMDSPGEFLYTLLVVAITPAIGEELVFRGILQRKLEENLKSPHFAILITALIFSFIHFQFQGFLPRVVLGLLLGYLFYWTRNLWVPIFAHFFINGFQVLIPYLMPEQLEQIQVDNIAEVNTQQQLIIAAISLIFLFFSGKWFEQNKVTN